MRKLFLAIATTTLLASCGGGTSTAEGAADALCDLTDQMVVAAGDEDEEKLKEIEEKAHQYEKEIKQAIKDGKYTENELEEILEKRHCMF